MRNIVTIARREIKSYFDSPTAYIVIVAFLLIAGWMFFSSLFLAGRADMRSLFAPGVFSPSMILVIIVPAVTMRLISEERKTGTIELVTTMPVTDAEVILGKFFGAFFLMLVGMSLTLTYAVSVAAVGELDWGPVISGYIGLTLFTASLVSIGLFCSTLTSNQIVAFIFGFIICAVLYFVYWLQFLVPQDMVGFIEYLSVSYHLDNIARGVIDSRDVLYYLTLTSAGLFMATRSLSSQHA